MRWIEGGAGRSGEGLRGGGAMRDEVGRWGERGGEELPRLTTTSLQREVFPMGRWVAYETV